MEVDEEPQSCMAQATDIQCIETGVQSLDINNETEKLNDICVSKESENEKNKIKEECEKAFLQFEKEREETFSRTCLLCKKHFTGDRSLILNHLSDKHFLFLGKPDNLVYVNEFLDALDSMLSKKQCIYCEKTYKDRATLKEHMRKKLHKRINPKNKYFDKFYMSNYLKMFDNLKFDLQNSEEEREIHVGPKDDAILCLICDQEFEDFDVLTSHLYKAHRFNWDYKKPHSAQSFYRAVKMINYMRRLVLDQICWICNKKYESKEEYLAHFAVAAHARMVPDRSVWDVKDYYFPTLETDYLICGLPITDDEEGNDSDDEMDVRVIPEDIVMPKSSVLMDENLRKELL